MPLGLDRLLSNFPEVEDFYPYNDIIHKFALVRERKLDWENLFGRIGAKERESSHKDKKATFVKRRFYSLHFAS